MTAPALELVAEVNEAMTGTTETIIRAHARTVCSYLNSGGEWGIALLVVRSVMEPRRGRPSKEALQSGKVSAREFAEMGGAASDKTITRMWRTWALAADDGKVPHPKDLDTTTDYVLPDGLPEWGKYYRQTAPARPKATAGSAAPVKRLNAAIACVQNIDQDAVLDGLNDEGRGELRGRLEALREWADEFLQVM